MPSVLTWIGRVALGLVGPLAIDGLTTLARPHGV